MVAKLGETIPVITLQPTHVEAAEEIRHVGLAVTRPHGLFGLGRSEFLGEYEGRADSDARETVEWITLPAIMYMRCKPEEAERWFAGFRIDENRTVEPRPVRRVRVVRGGGKPRPFPRL